MSTLKIDSFLSSDTDWEKNQYKILGAIRDLMTQFNRKKIYPALSELIDLNSMLEEVLKHKKNLKESFPRQISNIDLKNNKILFDTIEKLSPDVEFLFDLIEWALPIIKNAIEEGIVLFEYVEKNLKVEHVGILPLYKDEGYFIIPDNSSCQLQIHRFECSLFSSGSSPFRALKTKFIEAIEQIIVRNSPESLKLDLIARYKDLPNPATYICETDLDFPFNETLFPVAKRKLMGRIAA